MPEAVFSYSSQCERARFDIALQETLLAVAADNDDFVIVQTVCLGDGQHKRVRSDTDATLQALALRLAEGGTDA